MKPAPQFRIRYCACVLVVAFPWPAAVRSEPPPGQLSTCEKMGTGSGPAMQNPDNIADWPVPVPIFSQALSTQHYWEALSTTGKHSALQD